MQERRLLNPDVDAGFYEEAIAINERTRILALMNKFEQTNTKPDDLIGGWSWLKSQLQSKKSA